LAGGQRARQYVALRSELLGERERERETGLVGRSASGEVSSCFREPACGWAGGYGEHLGFARSLSSEGKKKNAGK